MKKHTMKIGMLVAGFILLFNPVFTVIDIIPDCIGFFLIVAALTKPAYFVARIDRARSLYFKLALVEVAKVFSIILQARISDNDNTFPLLLATVFGIAELLIFVPATINLFDGLSDCSIAQDVMIPSLAKTVNKYKTVKNEQGNREKKLVSTKEISLSNKVKRFILFFYSARVCATILPELTELEMYDRLGDVHAFKRSWASYKPHITVLVSIIIVILGIIYIVKVSRFFGRIKKEGIMNEIISKRFVTEVLPRTTLFIAKRMKNVMFFFVLSVIASFVLTFDYVNIMIGVIPSALLVTASALLLKYNKLAKLPMGIAIVRGILSVYNFICQIRYFDEYEFEAIFWIDEAKSLYTSLTAFETVEFALAIAATLSFIVVFMKALVEHISLCGGNYESAQYSKKRKDEETFKALKNKLIVCMVIAVLHFIMAALYWYLMPYFVAAGALGSVIGVLYIGYTIYAFNAVGDRVYDNEISIA